MAAGGGGGDREQRICSGTRRYVPQLGKSNTLRIDGQAVWDFANVLSSFRSNNTVRVFDLLDTAKTRLFLRFLSASRCLWCTPTRLYQCSNSAAKNFDAGYTFFIAFCADIFWVCRHFWNQFHKNVDGTTLLRVRSREQNKTRNVKRTKEMSSRSGTGILLTNVLAMNCFAPVEGSIETFDALQH